MVYISQKEARYLNQYTDKSLPAVSQNFSNVIQIVQSIVEFRALDSEYDLSYIQKYGEQP